MYNENYDKLNELLGMRLDEAISNRTDFEDYNSEPYLEAMKIAEVINNIDSIVFLLVVFHCRIFSLTLSIFLLCINRKN